MLFLSLNTNIAQDTITPTYLDTLTRNYVLPNEDAHALGKLVQDFNMRGVEIEKFYKEESAWLIYKANTEKARRFDLQTIINLMDQNNSLALDLQKVKQSNTECTSLISNKDKQLQKLDSSRKAWRNAAVAFGVPVASGIIAVIIKYLPLLF